MRRGGPVLTLLIVVAGPLPAQRIDRTPPSEQALRCGQRIAWETELKAALARAALEHRPVLWYVPTVPGSPMDRKPEIDRYMLFGPFAAPDVVSVIERRFVPLRAVPRGSEAKDRGLVSGRFIEPGILILDPQGKELFRVDKITTLRDEWFVRILTGVLAANPPLAGPSQGTKAAIASGEVLLIAAAHLQDGEAAAAEKALAGADAARPEVALLLGRALARQRKEVPAREALTRAAGTLPGARVELALLELRADRAGEAVKLLAQPLPEGEARRDEAQWLLGAAQHQGGSHTEGDKTWRQLAEQSPASPWAAKAAAEVERHGPFSRTFEELLWLPEDAFAAKPDGTCLPRGESALPALRKASVRFLLRQQKDNGSWDDSWYDFGGLDSLPNVYAAVTGLAAAALLAHRAVQPADVDRALDRAEVFLADESKLNLEDRDEIVWAHAYRAFYWTRALTAGRGDRDLNIGRLQAAVDRLCAIQGGKGIWAHEYPNPFASATVLQVLWLAESCGAKVERGVVEKGIAALLHCRSRQGAFSYGYSEGRAGDSIPSAAGRMPLCESALLVWGASDQDKLAFALTRAIEHHDKLETTRKYDDHVPQTLAYGGFFFWYDMLGRVLAIDRIEDRARRAELMGKQRNTILSIPEIDGTFVDSHELGKSYGTAMALLCLEKAAPGS